MDPEIVENSDTKERLEPQLKSDPTEMTREANIYDNNLSNSNSFLIDTNSLKSFRIQTNFHNTLSPCQNRVFPPYAISEYLEIYNDKKCPLNFKWNLY